MNVSYVIPAHLLNIYDKRVAIFQTEIPNESLPEVAFQSQEVTTRKRLWLRSSNSSKKRVGMLFGCLLKQGAQFNFDLDRGAVGGSGLAAGRDAGLNRA